MSFADEAREELARLEPESDVEALYELRGMALTRSGKLYTEKTAVARRMYALARALEGILGACRLERGTSARFGGRNTYELQFAEARSAVALGVAKLPARVTERGALLRGAFLAHGSVNDPAGDYHIEFSLEGEDAADIVTRALKSFELKPRYAARGARGIVYLKGGDAVAELLGRMGAHNAYMHMESARVMKDMRNSVNRQVNCDSANISKVSAAAERQIAAIELIERAIGLSRIPYSLEELARLRTDNPEATLDELGRMLTPPVGKSGANNRMRRIEEIAKKLST